MIIFELSILHELGQLCGMIRDSKDGKLYRMLVYALFPPAERLKMYAYKLSPEKAREEYTSNGKILNLLKQKLMRQ